MAINLKTAILSLAAFSLVSTQNLQPSTTLEETNIPADLPAITIQLQCNGKVKTKYAKLYAESTYGIWISLDNEENCIRYCMAESENGPSVLDIKKVSSAIKKYVSKNEDKMKETFSEIIDFQSLKHYYKALKTYLFSEALPSLGDINAKLRQIGERPAPTDHKETHVEVRARRELDHDLLNLTSDIALYQKKYNVSDENTKQVMDLLDTVQGYINSHPLSRYRLNYSYNITNNTRPFSKHVCGFDPCDPWQWVTHHQYSCPHCDSTSPDTCFCFHPPSLLPEEYRPNIIQFAYAATQLQRRAHSSSIESENQAAISAFFYLPPIEGQYGSADNFDSLANDFWEKLNRIEGIIMENKGKDILMPGASEKLKTNADAIVTKVIGEVKKQQERFNKEVDKACNKLKQIFA